MTRSEKIAAVNQWVQCFNNLQETYDKGYALLKCDPDSPWANAMFNTFEAYTQILAKLLGDKDEWLNWYIWENKAGKAGFEAKAASWKRAKKIKTAEDLLNLIEAKPKTRS